MAFKVPTCFVRTTLLMPAALVSTIVPFSNSKEGTGGDYLASNGKANCGPPYIVTPTQVSNEP
jgi:hypothetical protein